MEKEHLLIRDYLKQVQAQVKREEEIILDGKSVYTASNDNEKEMVVNQKEQKMSWYQWLFGKEASDRRKEEEEYLQYQDYLAYYYQLGELTDDWEKTRYDEVMKDEEFKLFREERRKVENEKLLKQFDLWKQWKEKEMQTSTWKQFASKHYLQSESYKLYQRISVKKLFVEYATVKKRNTQDQYLFDLSNGCLMNETSGMNMSWERKSNERGMMTEESLEEEKVLLTDIIEKLHQLNNTIDVKKMNIVLPMIQKQLPSFDLTTHLFSIAKSISFYQDTPDNLLSIIKEYLSHDLFSKQNIEELKKCELSAKLGFGKHLSEIKEITENKRMATETTSQREHLQKELIALLKYRAVDSLP